MLLPLILAVIIAALLYMAYRIQVLDSEVRFLMSGDDGKADVVWPVDLPPLVLPNDLKAMPEERGEEVRGLQGGGDDEGREDEEKGEEPFDVVLQDNPDQEETVGDSEEEEEEPPPREREGETNEEAIPVIEEVVDPVPKPRQRRKRVTAP